MRTGALNARARKRFAEGGISDREGVYGTPVESSPYAMPPDFGPPPEKRAADTRDARAPSAPSGALNDQSQQWFENYQRALGVGADQGALERSNIVAGRSAATQAKLRAIENTKNILAQVRMGQTTNLPLLAFGQGMLAPTRTGGIAEAMSAGLGQAIPQVQQQRQQDLGMGLQMGKLDIAAADTELAAQQDASNDFLKRMQMVGSAGTWMQRTQGANDRAGLNAATKLAIANNANELKSTLAGITDTRQREIAAAQWFVKKGILDETTQHHIWLEANGDARTDVARTNAGTAGRRADTAEQRAETADRDGFIRNWLTANPAGKFSDAQRAYEAEKAKRAAAKPTAGAAGAPAASPLGKLGAPPAPAEAPDLDKIIPGIPN